MADRVDVAWVLVSAALVFLMQAGFLCLESGLTRSKNNINVALKNLTDFALSVLIFWTLSFGVMFGPTLGGWVGRGSLLPGGDLSDPKLAAFFLFQAMFCGTAVTIVSGAVAERMRFRGYVAAVVLLSAVIYSLFGHWAWNGLPVDATLGWLGARGFYDFAGSTVVHSTGGWVALAAVLVLGPRTGRFDADGTPRRIGGSNLPIAMLGALFLWFGWYGFNGGSALGFTDAVPGILVNTTLAGAAGMVAAVLVGWVREQYADVRYAINGALAGLVAITAPCNAVGPDAALTIGAIGGVVTVAVERSLERMRIDDVIGAVPVHAGAGVWGTVAVALFGRPEVLGTGLGRLEQLGVQLLGAGSCFVWSFGMAYVVLRGIDRLFPLRVSAEAERDGLNFTEHRETTDLLELFRAMDEQAVRGDIALRMPVEPHTEVGQIAAHYNRVLDALQDALARTQRIVESAMDGIVTFAASGLTIERLNPSAEAMFGYRQAELVGRPIGVLVGDSGDGALEPPGGIPEGRRELVGVRRDGTRFPMEAVVAKVGAGPEAFCTGTFRDITEQKAVERALLDAKEAAEAASRTKSEFLASMSHELRTPLNAIIGYSEMVIEELDAPQSQASSDLDKIRSAGKHLLGLIDDVLDISKVEAGHLELSLESFDVAAMVQAVEGLVAPAARARRNALEVRLSPDVGRMHADETRVRQALSNLLGNACKFTKDGYVTLTVEAFEKAEAQWLRFRVEDTGIGIAPEHVGRLFEPFMQADASTTREYGGTGLGLAISQRFCHAMGGSITAHSEPGRGSTFTIELPRSASTDQG